jgi:hypothetical protein
MKVVQQGLWPTIVQPLEGSGDGLPAIKLYKCEWHINLKFVLRSCFASMVSFVDRKMWNLNVGLFKLRMKGLNFENLSVGLYLSLLLEVASAKTPQPLSFSRARNLGYSLI